MASVGASNVMVATDSYGPFGYETLLYQSNARSWELIRYRQRAFIDCFVADPAYLDFDETWFFAAKAEEGDDSDWALGKQRDGRIARLYQFNSTSDATDPPVSFPATDEPFANWYVEYCQSISAIH